MRIIEPQLLTPDALTASSIAESGVDLWLDSTSYTEGQQARQFFNNAYHVFECRIANTDEDPALSPVDANGDPYWRDLGATNRWAMFNGSVGASSRDTQDIVVEYTPGRRIDSIALFNVTGSMVSVSASSVVGGGIVYESEIRAIGTRGGGWWNWSFAEPVESTRYQFFDIPPYSDIVITVTVTTASGEAGIGELVFGRQFYLGVDELGMQPRIKDYSTNEFNAVFGYNTLVVRQTRRRLMITVVIPENRSDLVFRKMQSLSSRKLVFIADKYESGTIYGFFSEFDPDHRTHPLVFASLKVEGLI